MSDADLSLPRNRSLAGAHASGFEARLAGRSIYSNPYGDAIERGKKGWTYAFLNAWWEGWHVADSLVDPAPPPPPPDKLPTPTRRKRRTR